MKRETADASIPQANILIVEDEQGPREAAGGSPRQRHANAPGQPRHHLTIDSPKKGHRIERKIRLRQNEPTLYVMVLNSNKESNQAIEA